MSPALQNEMNIYNNKKIVLATNVIETGFTGEGIYYAIDCMCYRSVT